MGNFLNATKTSGVPGLEFPCWKPILAITLFAAVSVRFFHNNMVTVYCLRNKKVLFKTVECSEHLTADIVDPG